ncbi:hypothetical protein B0T24DRAFT_681281 [Lasiosphaeria ovina]|uniref:Uncharacterized protein n=1 Tax=Lasiosphaeria ovina TaxID=92902 RepID=A0AAE0N3X2_9PEZI|nr:hypothetical protein B0T24DRAFT_681281 [Lasiosphaeria ovina]
MAPVLHHPAPSGSSQGRSSLGVNNIGNTENNVPPSSQTPRAAFEARMQPTHPSSLQAEYRGALVNSFRTMTPFGDSQLNNITGNNNTASGPFNSHHHSQGDATTNRLILLENSRQQIEHQNIVTVGRVAELEHSQLNTDSKVREIADFLSQMTLPGEPAEAKTRIEAVEGELASLKANDTTLGNRIGAAKGELLGLEEANTRVRARVDAIQDDLLRIKSNNDTRIDTAMSTLGHLRDDFKDLSGVVSRMGKESTAIADRLANNLNFEQINPRLEALENLMRDVVKRVEKIEKGSGRVGDDDDSEEHPMMLVRLVDRVKKLEAASAKNKTDRDIKGLTNRIEHIEKKITELDMPKGDIEKKITELDMPKGDMRTPITYDEVVLHPAAASSSPTFQSATSKRAISESSAASAPGPGSNKRIRLDEIMNDSLVEIMNDLPVTYQTYKGVGRLLTIRALADMMTVSSVADFLSLLGRMDCRSEADLGRLTQFTRGCVSVDVPLWAHTHNSTSASFFVKVGGAFQNTLHVGARKHFDMPVTEQPPLDARYVKRHSILECVITGKETPAPKPEQSVDNGEEEEVPPQYAVALGEVYMVQKSLDKRSVPNKVTSTNYFLLMNIGSSRKSVWMVYRYEQAESRSKAACDELSFQKEKSRNVSMGGEFDTVLLLLEAKDWKDSMSTMYETVRQVRKKPMLKLLFTRPIREELEKAMAFGWEEPYGADIKSALACTHGAESVSTPVDELE